MPKSSNEYAELAGLTLALENIQNPPKPNTQSIIDWMKARIRELESK
jgi:ribonuclease HI